jgi:hypothetical protein
VFSGSSPGVCTVSGATVTYVAVGQCVVDANQAGNGTYEAAPEVQQTITVNPAPSGTPSDNSTSNARPS